MTTSLDARRRGLLWAFSSAVGVAIMVIPWKLANEVGTPAHSVLLLLGVAAIGNTGLTIFQTLSSKDKRFRIGLFDIGVAALLALFTLLGNWASAFAVQDLSPALLNVLLRVDILIVAVAGWILLGERVEPRFWIGASIAFVGLLVLQGPLGEGGLSGLLASGTGMAIASAACFSGLAIVTRAFIHRIDPVAVNSIRLWIAVALWFPFNDTARLLDIPSEQILYAGLAAICGPFLGRLALMISARHIEARVTTLTTLTAPILTLFFAFALLSDWPETRQLIGGAIMVGGIAVPFFRMKSETTTQRRHQKDSPPSN